MNSEAIWKKCLDGVGKHISPQHLTTWFKPISIISGDDNTLELEVPNRFFLEWIKEHYQPLIQEILRQNTSRDYTLNWNVCDSKPKANTPKQTRKAATKIVGEGGAVTRGRKTGSSLQLSPKYTFENFVVGKANEFAQAACSAVADHLSSKYNPLFIYGDVGLGKTHLLQAIGHHVLDKHRSANICYYTSERFMNEFISYVSRHKMSAFRQKFRNVDLLLIDDIQFWAGKERTQEEFFHTFNTLHEAHKQIVVTSDKFPKEIAGIEERLRSRFEWGLVADIQPPDTETKIAILKRNAEAEGITIPDEVILLLASVNNTNIRELEGYLTRVMAVSSLTGKEITLETSKEALKNITPEVVEKIPSIEEIQKAVCVFYNIKRSELRSKRRYKTIAFPRQLAMYLAREYAGLSYPEIGTAFGGKDHSTVIHAVKKIEKEIKEKPEIIHTIKTIKNDLGVF